MLTTPKKSRNIYFQKLLGLPVLMLVTALFAFRMQNTGYKKDAAINQVRKEISTRNDTINPTHNYGTYKGQPVKTVTVKTVSPKVIVTTKDGKKHEMTMKEAEQNKIAVPPPPPPMPAVTVVGYNVQDDQKTSINLKGNTHKGIEESLIVVDGVKTQLDKFNSISPENIQTINILKGQNAIDKYGEAGKNGVTEISTKTNFKTKADKPVNLQLTIPDKEPQFPGGDHEWRKFLERNLNSTVPIANHATNGSYNITVEFLVDKDGNISEMKALDNPGYGIAQEAIRVFGKSPNWEPATLNSKPVAFRKRQSITFLVVKS